MGPVTPARCHRVATAFRGATGHLAGLVAKVVNSLLITPYNCKNRGFLEGCGV